MTRTRRAIGAAAGRLGAALRPRAAASLAVAGVIGCLLVGTGTTSGGGGVRSTGTADGPEPAAAGPARPLDTDDLPGPFSEARRAQREAAVSSVVTASQGAGAGPHSAPDVVTLPAGPKVQLRPPAHARVFVVLVEFGDSIDRSAGVDANGTPKYGAVPGPRHGTIPEPDRSVDDKTVWTERFDRAYFHDLFFGDGSKGPSLATHYRAQSSGRMEVEGNVTDWVRVRWNEARYGSDACGAKVCTNVWELVRDAMNEWYADRAADGLSARQIEDALAPFDKWDRDDHDRDGDFDEPDGYLDHLEVVKAGADQAAGGGAQGANAIWSHRWFAYGDQAGRTGPPGNQAGGTRIGRSGVWAGDYTMQAENGGLGVIAHEFGHDLGLPDLYDRRDTGSGSPVAFWSLMGLGGYLGDGAPGLGNSPGSLSAWDRLQLGWLDWMIADPKATMSVLLAPLQSTGDPQAVLVPLPPRKGSTKARWYIVENRQYTGTDKVLRTGPYDGQGASAGSSHYPYGTGVMVWLWDTAYGDNDVADHPGQGLVLPIDAHAEPLSADNTAARARLAVFDAPFGLPDDKTDAILVGSPDRRTTLAPRPGKAVFDDRAGTYWSSQSPLAGVKVPAVGVRVAVESPARAGDAVRITVGPS
ncbi:immune inhibitor A domain-containing protein [Yinghuangia soli]|uniref:Immune inhibitor A n=1 Tax=Yinghuangia soli TaxID=2908204 RepID=A0AA41Q666_9ACTN|nr:immune inhibitor A domain-containing protein [Yinghuangia soli]MCF2532309.1 immune inhibitor A [Yinghuangia soli]